MVLPRRVLSPAGHPAGHRCCFGGRGSRGLFRVKDVIGGERRDDGVAVFDDAFPVSGGATVPEYQEREVERAAELDARRVDRLIRRCAGRSRCSRPGCRPE